MLPALLGLVVSAAPFPGVIIDHLPPNGRHTIGSPSLAILPNGDYVATDDVKGGVRVFRSSDGGNAWSRVSTLPTGCWSSLFVRRGALYLMGPNGTYGDLVIRRSQDGGTTWTPPTVLLGGGGYHSAPVPVVDAGGRVWRGFERREPATGWAPNFRAGVISAPAGADLMDPAKWTATNVLPSDPAWNGGDMGGWLEGNAVVTPDGGLVDVLRVQTDSLPEKAAIVRVSSDGSRATFDPEKDFVDLPGGAKKFTIRFDPRSGRYWSLTSVALTGERKPSDERNTLDLIESRDLVHWNVRGTILHGENVKGTGFQYADWQFDGDDIVAVVRTARREGGDKPKNAQAANFMTFHRVKDFRGSARDVPTP